MLAIAKLAPGQQAYYERSVAAGLDDYYAGRGESVGIWVGSGAAGLRLAGVVADGDLARLVSGIDPQSGALLRRHARSRTITVSRLDPSTGAEAVERRRLAPVAAFDLVFSTPKSISLLHALGDEATRLAVVRAHERAWQAAIRYLEDEACVTRRGAQGRIAEPGGGFVAAAFQHRTSRAQDPHLHTHVIVANMARSPDGVWRALDGRALLEQHRLAAGYLYQAQLRAELSRSLGVDWKQPVKGMAEIRGLPRAVLAEFSQRRRQVVERLDTLDGDGFHAAQFAAIETRDGKQQVELADLRRDWWARASEHGLTRERLAACLGRSRWHEPMPVEVTATAERLLGPNGLTEKQTTFASGDAVMAWANSCRRGADAALIVALVDELLRHEAVSVIGDPVPGRAGRYSTTELMSVERAALDLAERGRRANAPAASLAAVVEASTAGSVRLSSEQQAYVRVAATSAARIVCVVGVAGAGKTTATGTLNDALVASGIAVVGVAPSGSAAEQLGDETGIRATTIHRLLAEADRGAGLPPRSVVVIDEAGMADSRTLARILDLVEQADSKAILVGDPAQLPAVGAGGLFRALVERLGAVELTDNRRQINAAERAALAAIRSGRGDHYVAWARQTERLVVADDPIAARSRLLADWWQHARHDARTNVMIALRRRDVAELNALARNLLDAAGQLGRERLVAARQEFAVGDRIVCLRNNTILDVRNGTRGTVRAVDHQRRALEIETDRGDRVRLTRRYLAGGHLRHAYAVTGHASQGASIDRAFVLAHDRGALQEWGYVALSRARIETRTYCAQLPLESPGQPPRRREQTPDAAARLAAALRRSGAEDIAIEHEL